MNSHAKLLTTLAVTVTTGVLLLGFQNCARQNFGSDTASSTAASSGQSQAGSTANAPVSPSPGGLPAQIPPSPIPTPIPSPVPTPSGPTTPPTCQIDEVKRPIKLVFVVDTSGSNAVAFNSLTNIAYTQAKCAADAPASCVSATDPYKAFRTGTINAFFKKYVAKSNFTWGFLTFSGQDTIVTKSLIKDAKDRPTFADASKMGEAIGLFKSVPDDGGTPYLGALSATRDLIANDPDLKTQSATSPLYYVVLMSDGFPSDVTNNATGSAKLSNGVGAITSLAPGRIFLSTVYYSRSVEANAENVLSAMAATGGGRALTVNLNAFPTIDIVDIVRVPAANCQ